MKQELLCKTFTGARRYFPALTDYEGERVYLFDNSAGAQVPCFSINKVNTFTKDLNAQKGSIFKRLEWVQQMIIEGRRQAAELIGARDHTEIAFGLNATTFFTLFAHHLGRDLHAGDHIIITEADHISNITPWLELEERGIRVDVWKVTEDGSLDFDHYEELLKHNPKVVTVGWISNAIGTVHDMKRIARMAHDRGAVVVADGVQRASHLPIDIKDADVDFAAFSTYKIFGPHMGFCYVNHEHPERLRPFRIAEMLKEDSYKFEVGTQNHEGIISFIGSLEYLSRIAEDAEANGLRMAEIEIGGHPGERRRKLYSAMTWAAEYEKILSAHFLDKIKEFDEVELYGLTSAQDIDRRVPVFALNVRGRETDELGAALNNMGIEARTGNYLAVNLMDRLANRYGGSALRISMIHYNTIEEIDYFFECFRQILK